MASPDPSILSLDRSVVSFQGSSGCKEEVFSWRIPASFRTSMLIEKKNVCEDMWVEIFCRLPLKSLFRSRCVSRSWCFMIDNLNLTRWAKLLARLPVKTLIRFRCVSKSWRSLIDDLGFARLHLTQFNIQESRLFFYQRHSGEAQCVVRCAKTMRLVSRLGSLESYKMPIATFGRDLLRRVPDWYVFCTIDGIYMLNSNSCPSTLMLWNPSIRKARILPPRPPIPNGGGGILRHMDLGLAFDPSLEDYKHVRLVFETDPNESFGSGMQLHSVAVYTLGTDSWKITRAARSWRWISTIFYGHNTCVSLKGVIYFIRKTSPSLDSLDLVSFDLSTEMFAFTMFPQDYEFRQVVGLTLIDGGCSLGAVIFSATHGSIWVLSESDMSWTRSYTFPSTEPRPNPTLHPRVLFVTKSGNVLLNQLKVVKSYNGQTHKEDIVLKKNDHVLEIPSARGYVESLILLK